MIKFWAGLVLGAVFTVNHAVAGVISEIEPNSLLFAAQNVESDFSTGTNSAITNADIGWEWVSINSADGDDTFDYYSFTAEAGQNFVFDIDNISGDLDAVIALWSFNGLPEALHEQDDDCDEFGISLCIIPEPETLPQPVVDPRFSWEFDNAGTYVLGVARFSASALDFGFIGNSLQSGQTYTLQISREGDAVDVPEPASIALFAFGLIALAYTRKQKNI